MRPLLVWAGASWFTSWNRVTVRRPLKNKRDMAKKTPVVATEKVYHWDVVGCWMLDFGCWPGRPTFSDRKRARSTACLRARLLTFVRKTRGHYWRRGW